MLGSWVLALSGTLDHFQAERTVWREGWTIEVRGQIK